MGRKVANADALIAKIAARQYGIVSVWQLYGLGLGERAVRIRVDSGRLHRLHRGVYAVGHPALPYEARCIAAVLAVGGGAGSQDDAPAGKSVLGHWMAAVSHRSAAFLWGLLPAGEGPVDVVVPGSAGRARRTGIRVHRSRSLAPADVTLRHRIPVTKPARTIDDLRRASYAGRPGGLPSRDLRRAIRQANVLGLPIDEIDRRERSRSDLEGDFLQICRRYDLPAPEVNVSIGPHLVDFFWRDRRFVVETDSYLYHRGRVAFQDDRGRDLDLKRLGYEVLRLAEYQINEEPEQVGETLVAVLGSQRPVRD